MPVRLVQTNRCLQTASLADEESRAPGSSIVSAAAPVWPASAPAGATRGWLRPDSGPARLPAIAPLNLPPSCNKISGEDLLLRGSFRASFRVLCFEHECTLWEARLLSSHLSLLCAKDLPRYFRLDCCVSALRSRFS